MDETTVTTANAVAHENLLRCLQALAERSLARFELPPSVTARLINISENATYRIDEPQTGRKWALRVHRDGYHSRTAIQSELAWQMALKADGATIAPSPIRGRDGEFIQTVAHDGLPRPRNVVLFEWEDGSEPASTNVAGFELLGETAARMHAHVRRWSSPSWFERHTWDFDTSLGERPHWGRWRDGMGMSRDLERIFAETVELIGQRLALFGKGPDRFGLVHGDMRLANLLTDGKNVKVIDFDDCGFSWFLYDCATTVSFFEHAPEVPELLKAWVRGYRRIGSLSAEDEAEIETFVMLRRLLLVAWIGSHSETDLAQSMGVQYTADTEQLCESYLTRFGCPGSRVTTARTQTAKPGFWQRLFG